MIGKINFHITSYFLSIYSSLLATALQKIYPNVNTEINYMLKELMCGILISGTRFLNYPFKISDFNIFPKLLWNAKLQWNVPILKTSNLNN